VDILGFIATSALLTLMPGPDIFFVLSQGLTRGRKPALAVAAGLASGLLVHTTAAALGLSLIISRSPVLLQVIKYAGVAYLAYMGVKAFAGRNKTPEAAPETAPTTTDMRPTRQMFRVGVTMNLLNPKVILFFLALFPQFLNPESSAPKADIFLLGGIFSGVALTIFSTVAVVSGFVSDRLSPGRLSHRATSWINAVVYWAIAVFFLFISIEH
jgi:threonine/homoserine/homoserine lactone efflux protein